MVHAIIWGLVKTFLKVAMRSLQLDAIPSSLYSAVLGFIKCAVVSWSSCKVMLAIDARDEWRGMTLRLKQW